MTSNLAKEKIRTVARRLHEAAEEGFKHTGQEISSQKGMCMLLYGTKKGRKMMKINIMAGKEELRVNERLITGWTHEKLIPKGNVYTGTIHGEKEGKKIIKKDVVAEGEELRANDRAIPSELRVLGFLYNTVRICPFPDSQFSDIEKKIQSPQTQRKGELPTFL